MSLELGGESGFSMLLEASLHPAPPHHFHNATQTWATCEADAGSVRRLLPPGV